MDRDVWVCVSVCVCVCLFIYMYTFLYRKEKQSEKEIKEMTPFIVVPNNMKYLSVTLTKEVKDLYDKNFKILKKEI